MRHCLMSDDVARFGLMLKSVEAAFLCGIFLVDFSGIFKVEEFLRALIKLSSGFASQSCGLSEISFVESLEFSIQFLSFIV